MEPNIAPGVANPSYQGITVKTRGAMDKKAKTLDPLQPDPEDLEDFFENAAVGLHIIDHNGFIVRANKAELAMLGYSAEEYIGRHISAFHMDPEIIKDVLSRLGRGEEIIRFPARLRAADGSVRHGLITSNGQFNEGKFVNTRCVTIDVTGEKLAQDSARDGELRFRTCWNCCPLPSTRLTLTVISHSLMMLPLNSQAVVPNLESINGALPGSSIGPMELSCRMTSAPWLSPSKRSEPLEGWK